MGESGTPFAFYILAATVILVVGWIFWRKYRIVFGGTKVDAVVVRHGDKIASEVLSFENDGHTFEIASLPMNLPRAVGTEVKAYFNPKYPGEVVPTNPVFDTIMLLATLAFCIILFVI